MTWQPSCGVSYSHRTLSPGITDHRSLPFSYLVFVFFPRSKPASLTQTNTKHGTETGHQVTSTKQVLLAAFLETVVFYILLHSWHSPLVPFPSRFVHSTCHFSLRHSPFTLSLALTLDFPFLPLHRSLLLGSHTSFPRSSPAHARALSTRSSP